MVHRPFRFSVTSPPVSSAADFRELARRVEDLGYDTLHLADHVATGLAPIPALAVAAAATSTLRIGPLVLCNDLRNPIVAAKELATLDLLSEGRLEWGMGAGWVPADYEATGIAMAPGAERVAHLADSIARMKEHFATVVPEPVQRPHPPLVVGGAQPGLLKLAAREADVISIAPSLLARSIFGNPPECTPAQAFDRQLAWIRPIEAERATPPAERHVTLFPALITDDARARAADVGRSIDQGVDEVLEAPHVLLGTVDAACDALEERRERWGISYITVQTAAAEAFAPVVERLRGK